MPQLTLLPPGSLTAHLGGATPAEKRRIGYAIRVMMHWRGFTLEQPLLTSAVANCLVMVLNKRNSTSGTLAHFNIVQSGFTDEAAAFHTVNSELAKMVESLGGDPSKIEVLLWKGSGFARDGNPGFAPGHSYADHGIDAAHFAAVLDHMDKQRPYNQSGALVFDPISDRAYELSAAEDEALSSIKAPPEGSIAIEKMPG